MRIIDALEYLDQTGNVEADILREDIAEFLETVEYMLNNTEFHHISQWARGWRHNHLLDEMLFEKFIQEKAWELNSGDHLSDYYQALAIRRDQLLALRDVIKEYLNQLSSIYNEYKADAADRMSEFDIHGGMYLRAQDYKRHRDEVLDAYRNQDVESEEENLDTELDYEIELLENIAGEQDSPKRKSSKAKSTSQKSA